MQNGRVFRCLAQGPSVLATRRTSSGHVSPVRDQTNDRPIVIASILSAHSHRAVFFLRSWVIINTLADGMDPFGHR